jgi:hypothetical protein
MIYLFSQQKKFCKKNLFFKFSYINFQKILIGLIILIFLLYFFSLISDFFLPPKIVIFFPPEGYETKERMIQIRGLVKKGVIVKINDLNVSKFENGFFEETLNLLPGVNEIKISAKKRNGLGTVIWRKIIVRE